MKITHKQNLLAAALVGALAFATSVAQGGETGHYGPGVPNIRDFVVPEPGFYGAVYNYYYTTDRLNDRNGNKVSSVTINPGGGPGVTLGVDVDVDVYVVSPMFIWVSDWKMFGAKYAAYIAPSFANSSVSASLALLTVPVTLYLLSEALGFQAEVSVLAVARVVGMTLLLPVCLGILIRSFFPKVADTIGPALAKVGGVALLILVLFVVATAYGLLMKMDLWSYFVMAMVVAVSIAIGHWLGPRDAEEQTTLAVESAARHPGLAMTIAALNFSPQKALPVLIPYLIVFMVVTTIYLQWRKRRATKLPTG